MSRVSNIYPNKSNVSFEGCGKITRFDHKFNDAFIDRLCIGTSAEGVDFISAFAKTVGQNVDRVKSIFGDSIEKINELCAMAKEFKKTENLKENLKKIITLARKDLADENGYITKLPAKEIIIHEGNDPIDDHLEADVINDWGSRGIKSLTGGIVSIFNVKNEALEIFASRRLKISNSTLKSYHCNNNKEVSITNSEIIDNISKTFTETRAIAKPKIKETNALESNPKFISSNTIAENMENLEKNRNLHKINPN